MCESEESSKEQRKDPTLSIIIPVHNGEKYISTVEGNIKEISNECSKQVEIIIINDGSNDETGSKLKALQKRLRQEHDITLKELKKSEGVAHARNVSLKLAKGKYLWFVDCDDTWSHDAVSDILATIAQKKADLYLFQANRIVKSSGRVTRISAPDGEGYLSQKELVNYFLWTKIEGHLWNKIFSKELFRNVQFPNMKSKSDAAAMVDLLSEVDVAYSCNIRIYNYNFHNNSIATSNPSPWDLVYVLRKASSLAEKYRAKNSLEIFAIYGFALPVLSETWKLSPQNTDSVVVERFARSLISLKACRLSVPEMGIKKALFALGCKVCPQLTKDVYRSLRHREWLANE